MSSVINQRMELAEVWEIEHTPSPEKTADEPERLRSLFTTAVYNTQVHHF
jgi:hypothetical protein